MISNENRGSSVNTDSDENEDCIEGVEDSNDVVIQNTLQTSINIENNYKIVTLGVNIDSSNENTIQNGSGQVTPNMMTDTQLQHPKDNVLVKSLLPVVAIGNLNLKQENIFSRR